MNSETKPVPQSRRRPDDENEDTGVRNIYDEMPDKFKPKLPNPNYSLHGLSTPFRMIVVAASGGGKSNFLYNLLEKFSLGKGTFSTITIVCACAQQSLYRYLVHKCPSIRIVEGMGKTPPLDEFETNDDQQHLVVWDDLLTVKNQEIVDKYYIRSRHKNVSCIYLTQSFFATSITMRKQCNFVVLLAIGGVRDVKTILKDTAINVTGDQLLNMYEYATKTPLTPLIVNTTKGCDRPFRKGFLIELDPSDFL